MKAKYWNAQQKIALVKIEHQIGIYEILNVMMWCEIDYRPLRTKKAVISAIREILEDKGINGIYYILDGVDDEDIEQARAIITPIAEKLFPDFVIR